MALAKRAARHESAGFDGSEQIHFRGETNTVSYMLHDILCRHSPSPMAPIMLRTKPRLFWRCFETAKRMGWHIVDYSEKDGRIEATDTSASGSARSPTS